MASKDTLSSMMEGLVSRNEEASENIVDIIQSDASTFNKKKVSARLTGNEKNRETRGCCQSCLVFSFRFVRIRYWSSYWN